MQLRMVAPLDIGLEQTDAQLGLGQDDVFDLDNVERGLRRRKDVINLADGEMSGESSEEDAALADGAEQDEDETLDSDEERERKVKGLEDELDGLYDSYRTQLAERDAKFRVKEARRKNALRNEEWGGVQKGGSDDEGSGEESEGEGGWDVVAQRKAAAGEDSDSSEDEEAAAVVRKRRKLANGKAGLITSLDDQPKPSKSRAAQVWFSQDVFAGVPDIDELEDDNEEEEESSEEAADTQDTSLAEDDEAVSEVCSIDLPVLTDADMVSRMILVLKMISRSFLKHLTMMSRCGMLTTRMKTQSSSGKSWVDHIFSLFF